MSLAGNINDSSGRDSPTRLKQELLKTATDKTGKKMMNPLKLPEIFSYFDTPNREKKWAAPNADVTDYFNYGLTEETFKLYAQKVKNLFNKLQKTGGAHFKQGVDSDKFYEDKLPISHGGLEIIDDNVLKSLIEPEWELLFSQSDAYLDLIFKRHGDLDDLCKAIKNTNNSVGNVYGLKKDPPPNVTVQPPPANYIPKPQPPPMTMHQPPPRMTPPPMGPPGMFPPPTMHHQMDFPGYQPMMPRPPYMGFPPKPYDFNPMFPGMPPAGRPPMEMVQPDMGEKKPDKKKKEEESDGSDESSDEKEKGKSQSKTSERHKRSKSREKKHKSHHRDKDSESHQESKHHSHHRSRHERDDSSKRNHADHEERSSKRNDHYSQSSKERERDEVKHEDSYRSSMKDDGDQNAKSQGGRDRKWQKGYINNLIGSTAKEGRERKDKRSSR